MPRTLSYPLIVIGCHRSGTSWLSRTLQQLGVFNGRDLNVHDEAKFFLQQNVHVFERAGASWDTPLLVSSRLEDSNLYMECLDYLEAKTQGREFVHSYWGPLRYLLHRTAIRRLAWGWKDPRNTITLPLWLDLYKDARVIHIFRNGVDVARSMMVREERRNPANPLVSERCSTMTGAFELWKEYEATALAVTSHLSKDHLLRLRYEDCVLDPAATIRSVAQFVGSEDKPEKYDAQANADGAFRFRGDATLCGFYETVRSEPIMTALGYGELASR